MRVLLNGRFLDRPMSGVTRFAIETVKALDEMVAEGDGIASRFDFELIVPARARIDLPLRAIPHRRVGGRGGLFWEHVRLGRSADADAWLVSLCNSAPLWRRRQLVVIHDVATVRVPQSYRLAFRAWYALMIPHLYRRADAVLTVSDFSRRELAALYGPRDDVSVIQEGTEHMCRVVADDRVLRARGLDRRPYFLVVGSPARHKNLEVVVKAIGLLHDETVVLAVAGRSDPRVFSSYAYGSGPHIELLGEVTDSELKALYQHASAFVFPSRYEGYGLPPTEAMACGCPVIASDQEAVASTVSDASLRFPVEDEQALAGQMRRILADPGLRARLRSAGEQRAASLSWRKTAVGLAEGLRQAVSREQPPSGPIAPSRVIRTVSAVRGRPGDGQSGHRS